ncbi:biosynthetic-type acetolactate synthase large subunit [Helicobacter saguini]|uniref:Acetolactate synthase n=1 Tax=Helicobacter saguini TaxID=1548018 RepID=A0A4U8SYP7_9HELI|nr:biosynthetic-type acetolactate synthase large subunit [Helicobacter saguini]MWV62960.1 biosynthetic-type acetolactate synthase large subunit [Helicobacter saguini]MWV71726.1 biosynthetic-type acetolactate synthase large subunit [Helicobacter saguini]TLD92169.1 biosynthetic-type acetolactate synthase large subunit [Helicobacter saguini]
MSNNNQEKKINGSRMLIEALHLEDVKVIFGYPGGAVLNIYDEIFKQDYFRHILVRHEQAALHAADGYARASGKVGVAIITSGPGFTNAVTGIATAFTDSIPLVVISGQVPLPQIGTDSFQEIDAVGISRPCTKHNYLVQSIKDLPRIIKEAFYIARSGRPGPVLVDIPKDISAQIDYFNYPKAISLATYKPTIRGNLRQIKKLANVILDSKNPLFYIGGGAVISDSFDEVRELLNLTQIPSVETLMARGIAQGSENFLGMLGMHGTYAANMAASECDLLISLGARFDDRVTGKVSEFAKFAKIAHIDIDPSSIGKIIEVNYPIVGDLKLVLQDLINELRDKPLSDSVASERRAWISKLKKWSETHPLKYKDSIESNALHISKKEGKSVKPLLKPQWVIEQTGKILGSRAVVSTDVGQHQMWVAQFYPFSQKRQFITSGGLGTMGYGLPANIGVAVALSEANSPTLAGDATFSSPTLAGGARGGVEKTNHTINQNDNLDSIKTQNLDSKKQTNFTKAQEPTPQPPQISISGREGGYNPTKDSIESKSQNTKKDSKDSIESNQKIALSFSGDGGILMNIQELMTCVESNIKTINIILNNGYLGMVKQWQDFFYEKRLSHVDLAQPNFTQLASSFGVLGLEAHTKEEFINALQTAINSPKTSLINVWVDRDEIVLPMVPGGNPLYKMILE